MRVTMPAQFPFEEIPVRKLFSTRFLFASVVLIAAAFIAVGTFIQASAQSVASGEKSLSSSATRRPSGATAASRPYCFGRDAFLAILIASTNVATLLFLVWMGMAPIPVF